MSATQKKILAILLVLSGVYFVLFIFPNLTGAQDPNMLSIFEVDEYAQYPHVISMLVPGPTFYQSVRNFLIYLHYFYGYPFYFFSALAILPLKWIFGPGWQAHTAVIVAVLRQFINVLPMLAGVLLLVYTWTHFKSLWRSLGLFLLLIAVPAVVDNNLWWHPDSLALLFVALVFFFLDRDNQRFGRNFILAAVFCGLAVGTKYMGVFFVFAIPLYLVWGALTKKINWRRSLGLGALFLGVMAAAVVVSNPLLLLPQERAELIHDQVWQFQQTTVGIIMKVTQPYFSLTGGYPQDFRIHYGELLFVLLALAALGLGLVRSKNRLQNALVLAWIIPLIYTIDTAATRRTYYFIPVMLPLLCCLVNFFPEGGLRWIKTGLTSEKLSIQINSLAPWLLGGLIVLQAGLFLNTDIQDYLSGLNREKTSPSIIFYNALEAQLKTNLAGQKLVVYRDWHMYFPEREGKDVEIDWTLPNYAYINDLNPDLMLLEEDNIKTYSQANAISQAVNPEDMRQTYTFYLDASKKQIAGYQLLLDSHFGAAYLRDNLYQQYFANSGGGNR
jgi:hypothetical protein